MCSAACSASAPQAITNTGCGERGSPQRRHLTDEALLAHIRAVHAETRGAYGWPRIWRELVKRGVRVGKQRVQRLMQAARHSCAWQAALSRGHDRQPARSAGGAEPVGSQLLTGAPEHGLVGRHHVHRHRRGLAISGRGDRPVQPPRSGLELQPHMQRSLVIDALEMAWQQRRPEQGRAAVS